jgi:hypothetical protein
MKKQEFGYAPGGIAISKGRRDRLYDVDSASLKAEPVQGAQLLLPAKSQPPFFQYRQQGLLPKRV